MDKKTSEARAGGSKDQGEFRLQAGCGFVAVILGGRREGSLLIVLLC